jgi:two-component system chemotaxis response regulator CheB
LKTAAAGFPPIQVLVVDDSAVVRQALTAVLGSQPDIEVTTASDPIIALAKMKRRRPDVILLDLVMPRMDGLTFLAKVMAEDPVPVVICSEVAQRGTEAAVQALEAGAVDIVAKPRFGVQTFLQESAVLLADAVRAAAQVHRRRFAPAAPVAAPRVQLPRVTGFSTRLVAIGASTGGTEAIRHVLEALPRDAPPLLIVQHMPEKFTAAYAARLNETCVIEVREAADGDAVVSGCALIAPGNFHLTLKRVAGRFQVAVTGGPLVSRHRPSVDVLFRSVAEVAGPAAIGVLLTGMGDDGALGLLAMRNAGASTIAQDEATSVVFGMPKEAIERGAAESVLPLQAIPGAIVAATSSGRAPRQAPSPATNRTPEDPHR